MGSLYTGYLADEDDGTEGAPYKVEGIGGDKTPTRRSGSTSSTSSARCPTRIAMAMARRLAREEGILVGGSAGLNVALALEIARELDDPDACVVTILCDTGERYLSKVVQRRVDAGEPAAREARRHRRAAARVAGPERAARWCSVAPAAQVRQALNLMSTWGVSQIPGDGRRATASAALVEGTLMTERARAAGAARPARA